MHEMKNSGGGVPHTFPVDGTVFDDDEEDSATPMAAAGEEVDPHYGTPLNDAEWLGAPNAEMDALLGRNAVVLTGEVWGMRDRRNTQDGDWKRAEMPWGALIAGGPKTPGMAAWGFSRHPVGKDKAGSCWVLGDSIGGARKAKAMTNMYAMGLDIDSGAKLDDVIDRIEDLGLFCLVYTSYNHGKRGIQLKRDEVLKKLQITTDPTLDQVKDYLREFDKNRYEADFVAQITIKDARMQTADGVVIALDTPPLEKFRLIFPLAEPVKIVDLADTQAASLEMWEDKITGLAVKLLGLHFDTSCTDPSRLFYAGRHPANAAFYAAVIRGRPLTFDEVPAYKKSLYTKHREPLNAFLMAGNAADGDRPPQALTPSGKSLNEWHSNIGKSRFMVADLLETYCSDRIRVAGGEAQGHVHVECPFEHEHTSEGGTACMAVNCIDSPNEFWGWWCHHDACQGRHKLQMLEQALREGWFEEELLFGDEFLLPADDDDLDSPAEVARQAQNAGPLTRADWRTADAAAATVQSAGLSPDSSEADVECLLMRAFCGKIDGTGLTRLWKAVEAANVSLGKRDWNRLAKEARTAVKSQRAEEEALQCRADGRAQKIDVTTADFDVMCAAVREGIATRNVAEPYFFEHLDRPAVIRRDAEGRARIHHHNKDGVASEINKLRMFQKPLGDEGFRGVSVPLDIVTDIHAGDLGSFSLPLRGVVRSPFFSPSGELIDQAGYHRESKVYYVPPTGFEVPPVSERPSTAEVNEAKRLLIEEVFADFPLGGLTRPEIVERSLRGDGVPAVTNLIGLAVLPFMRDMIAGPTPGHLVTKPAPGTGASLMMDAFSTIANGQPSPAQPMPSRPDEMTKTLTSVIADGLNIAFFDNITHSVDSGDLASALTASTYGARILGRSEIVQAEVRCVWVFTGNNTKLSAELVRRLLMIDLDAHLANPELRRGFRHTDLMGWVRANRGRLVWACLTLIQNWIAGGMVPDCARVLASYEDWSRKIGGVLKAAGLGGFMGNSEELREMATDDREDGVRMLMKALSAYSDGTVFRPSSTQGAVVGLMDVLNGTGEEGEAIYIDGWGYSSGEGGYLNANRIGRNFKTIAKKPHRVSIAEGDWELKFEALKDTRNGTR